MAEVTFEWEMDPEGCWSCECCPLEERQKAEVLGCVAKIDGKVMDSLWSICGIPVVTEEYRREVEKDMKAEALLNYDKLLRQRGRVLWARI